MFLLLCRYLNKNLVIYFERYFSTSESSKIEKDAIKEVQNDSVFFEGSFLIRFGLTNTQNFTEKFAVHAEVKIVDLFELSVFRPLFCAMLIVSFIRLPHF